MSLASIQHTADGPATERANVLQLLFGEKRMENAGWSKKLTRKISVFFPLSGYLLSSYPMVLHIVYLS